MPLANPSQYVCDNEMQQGDMIYVRKRNIFYKLYRELFKKPTKIRVRKHWKEPIEYNTYYQEDCTLVYSYEILCVQNLDGKIPVFISKSFNDAPYKATTLKHVKVGLNNLVLTLPDNKTYTMPINQIKNAIQQNEKTFKSIEDKRIVKDLLRFQRYKGNYFKQYVSANAISEWVPSYCIMCGKPVKFEFDANGVHINNECVCDNMHLEKESLTYDEFALWYGSQTNKFAKKIYNKFWFKKE